MQLYVVEVALVGVTVVSTHPQVNQEIDREDDLLAVDSFRNKVKSGFSRHQQLK